MFIEYNHQVLKQHWRYRRAMTIATERYAQLCAP